MPPRRPPLAIPPRCPSPPSPGALLQREPERPQVALQGRPPPTVRALPRGARPPTTMAPQRDACGMCAGRRVCLFVQHSRPTHQVGALRAMRPLGRVAGAPCPQTLPRTKFDPALYDFCSSAYRPRRTSKRGGGRGCRPLKNPSIPSPPNAQRSSDI